MACKLVVLAVIVFLGFAHTLPVDIDQDTEFVPRNVYRHASRTSPASGSEVPNYAPGGFPGISFPDFTRIQEYFDAIRKRIAETFSSTFDGIDLDAGNKTSETRIINGNKVTINRTIYENDGVHYVVKNIQVRPLDGTEDEGVPEVTTSITRTATGVRDIESLDNEINREVGGNNPERIRVA